MGITCDIDGRGQGRPSFETTRRQHAGDTPKGGSSWCKPPNTTPGVMLPHGSNAPQRVEHSRSGAILPMVSILSQARRRGGASALARCPLDDARGRAQNNALCPITRAFSQVHRVRARMAGDRTEGHRGATPHQAGDADSRATQDRTPTGYSPSSGRCASGTSPPPLP